MMKICSAGSSIFYETMFEQLSLWISVLPKLKWSRRGTAEADKAQKSCLGSTGISKLERILQIIFVQRGEGNREISPYLPSREPALMEQE